jgi:low affinity Fe/Cu permease
MNSIKSGSIKLYHIAVAVIILAGIGVFVSAFLGSDIQLQIALGLGGVGLLSLGLIIIKLVRDTKKAQGKLDAIIAKLDELQQELQKKEEPDKSGIAIADIISSSMKFYSEYKSKEKKEDENPEV